MSVTLISSPGRIRPAYNPIEWVVNSSNKASCDFSYVCDLYVNGSFSIRLKFFPEGASDYGYVRIHKVLQNYLSYNFRPAQTQWAANNQGICSYYFEVRESYNTSSDCTGDLTLSSVLYTSPIGYAWNGALQYHEYKSFTQSIYVCSNLKSRFLTTVPNRSLIPLTEKFTINFIQATDDPVFAMIINTYDKDHVPIAQYQMDNVLYSISSPADPEDLLITVGVGPANINEAALDGSPTQPVIDSNVRYYDIRLVDYTLNRNISERKEFEIDYRCTKYPQHRIWWLNRLGGFDSYTFNLKSSKSIDISRATHNKLPDTDYALGDRGESVINVNAGESYKLSSNWLTEEEGKWMETLFTSPEVYVSYEERKTFQITGGAHNIFNATAYLVIEADLVTGTLFEYAVSDGSIIGIESAGSGKITGYDSGLGYYLTSIPSSLNAGGLFNGYITTKEPIIIPLVVNSASYDEKLKSNIKNINHTIDVRPSYKLNIQSL